MKKGSRKKRGAQPGNQNGRIHGFYSRKLSPDLHEALESAARIEGLDQEIGLLRLKISMFADDPDHGGLLIPGMSLLSRLLRTRQRLGYDGQDKVHSAVLTVLRDIGLPLGLSSLITPGARPAGGSAAAPAGVHGATPHPPASADAENGDKT